MPVWRLLPLHHRVSIGQAGVGRPDAGQKRPTQMGIYLCDGSGDNVLDVSETKGTAMLVGYARTSTVEQEAGLAAQERDLRGAGAEKIFSEQVSSVAKRAQLEAAIDFVRDGDVLAVTKPCRLARSTADLLSIVARLETKGVALRILSMGGASLDTSTPTGKLMLTVLGGIAEFERGLMLERQREGIATAKSEGRYKGRAPTARAKADDVRRLHAAGTKPVEIAAKLGISRASVYRALEG